MIQLQEMANFMYDNIISQMQWQQKKAIIERKASRPRTAPPAGFLVADTYPSPNYGIKFLKMFQPLHNKLARLRARILIFLLAPTMQNIFRTQSEIFHFFANPIPFAFQKYPAALIGNEKRNS